MITQKKPLNQDLNLKPMQALGLVVNYFLGYQGIYTQIGLFYSKRVYGLDGLHPRVTAVIYSLTLVVSCVIARDYLVNHARRFKLYWKQNMKSIAVISGGLLALNGAVGLVMYLFLSPEMQSMNQQAVERGFRLFPALNLFATVIMAPLVEEVLFRGVFYDSIFQETGSKVFAILCSSVLFGAIHAYPSALQTGNMIQLLYIIPYGCLGLFMIAGFEKTSSIWGSIGVHFINNGLAAAVVLIRIGMGM